MGQGSCPGVSIFLVSIVGVALSLAVRQLFLGAKGLAPDLGNWERLRILLGTALYLTAIALLAFAIGALRRHSSGAPATVLGLLLVIENLAQIPWKPLQLISAFLPGTAGSKILMTQAEINAISHGSMGAVPGPWQGFAVLLAWVAVLLRHRNADSAQHTSWSRSLNVARPAGVVLRRPPRVPSQ